MPRPRPWSLRLAEAVVKVDRFDVTSWKISLKVGAATRGICKHVAIMWCRDVEEVRDETSSFRQAGWAAGTHEVESHQTFNGVKFKLLLPF